MNLTSSAPVVDDPETLAELTAAFARYESALLRNDVEALNAFFWADARVLRYGLGEHSQGHAAICAYRRRATPVHPERRLERTVITSFGRDTGSVCTEFRAPDNALLGRQTQTWVRFALGWRIVAAHVSHIDPGLVENAACAAPSGAEQ